MTMNEEQKPSIDLESIVNVEAIFGRPLLDEVAAVTREIEEAKKEIRALLERAAGASKACSIAMRQVYPTSGYIPGLEDNLHVHDGLGAVLDAAAGLTKLSEVAGEAGLHDAIFEPDFKATPFVAGSGS